MEGDEFSKMKKRKLPQGIRVTSAALAAVFAVAAGSVNVSAAGTGSYAGQTGEEAYAGEDFSGADEALNGAADTSVVTADGSTSGAETDNSISDAETDSSTPGAETDSSISDAETDSSTSGNGTGSISDAETDSSISGAGTGSDASDTAADSSTTDTKSDSDTGNSDSGDEATEEKQKVNEDATPVAMYRMYNPRTGEHLYTADLNERNTLFSLLWNYEGIGWYAPKKSDVPVYRLFNPLTGEHHYTMDLNEYRTLGSLGWNQEGIGWYSDADETIPLYRQFNSRSELSTGSHNYTADLNEYMVLTQQKGWTDEGIAWYALKSGSQDSIQTYGYNYTYTPGGRTLKNLLKTGLMACGRTLYVWGGGHASDADALGYQSKWEQFFNMYKNGYNMNQHLYAYGYGLDCSGYVSWAVFNTLYSSRSNSQYINDLAADCAKDFAGRGWCNYYEGSGTEAEDSDDGDDGDEVPELLPGDIVSMSGHVYISLGQYDDGSTLILHCSPNGVQISGTDGEAYRKACYYMRYYFTQWPYPEKQQGRDYYDYVGVARWKTDGSGILTDPESIQKMTPDQVMNELLK